MIGDGREQLFLVFAVEWRLQSQQHELCWSQDGIHKYVNGSGAGSNLVWKGQSWTWVHFC